MAGISSSVGLASGIDSKAIIDQLIALEQQPKINLLTRINTENKKKAAYTDLQTRLSTVRIFAQTIKKPQTFRAADVKSTDEGVVTGTAAAGAAAGTYQLSVARLVSAQQAVSKGFADVDATNVGAGTLTVELGGGDLRTATRLDELNGGEGVRRGTFRITDRAGISADVDVTGALTLSDVVDQINRSEGINVRASIANDALVVTDQTGRTTSRLIIADVGDGEAAGDLGIRQNVAAALVTGTRIGGVRPTTLLSSLNGGRGLNTSGTTAADVQIKLANGNLVDVDLDAAETVADAILRINTALGARGTADINTVGHGIRITDTSRSYTGLPAGQRMTVTSLNATTAAADLGLVGAAGATGLLEGQQVAGGVNTTFLKSLRGGRGLNLGTIRIRDRNNVSSDVNLAGATTIDEVLLRINNAPNNVIAEVKPGGNGITITDKTRKFGPLVISDVSGTSAAELGIVGTFAANAANATINGANLQKAWFTRDTPLRDLNGGKGVPDGKFRLTDSLGKTRTIDVDPAKLVNVGDLMDVINVGTTVKVKASINANGDGLLLTDSAGGALPMKVEELDNGGAAKALNIAGPAVGATIDGSWEKTIAVAATDKLQDVQKKVQDLNWGLSAAIINDGSKDAPYRLSLSSVNTGRAGRVVFDSGQANLGERVLVEAQDAAVFVGSSAAAQPLLITASSNQITGAIRGVTLNLNGVSKSPVTVNVARNVDNVVTAAAKFVEDFNGLVAQLKAYTKFDSASNVRGELLGDTIAQSVEAELYGALNTVGNPTGRYRIAADVGITVGDGGNIEFDEARFRDAYADDPDGVTTLFTRGGTAIDEDYPLQNLRNGQGMRSTAAGADFRIGARDGTGFDVDASDLTTAGQLLDAINAAAGNNGKVVASLNATGTAIDLLDKSTTGTAKFAVSVLNGSVAASDLGLLGVASNGRIPGRSLIDANAGDRGGIGAVIEKRINRLIDPVSGVVARASRNVDERNDDFQDRIDSIDKLVASKRQRLERQFANLESSLSSLQSQQSSLGALNG